MVGALEDLSELGRRGSPRRARQRIRSSERQDPVLADLERVPGFAAKGERKPLQRDAVSMIYPVTDHLLIFESLHLAPIPVGAIGGEDHRAPVQVEGIAASEVLRTEFQQDAPVGSGGDALSVLPHQWVGGAV